MVDIDDLKNAKDGGSKKKNKSSGSSSSSSSSSSGDDPDVGAKEGTFTLGDDEVLDPSDTTMSQQSKDWAEEHGDLNYEKQGSESLQQFMKRQKEEVEELHANIRKRARQNDESFEQFTLIMHTLLLNFAQNRVGIAKTIENQFGKSEDEALRLTNKICQKAGEEQFVENMIQDVTENLLDL